MRPLLLIVCFAAVSAGQSPSPGADAQKFDAVREFVRARNVRDYAITTPDGIDEAAYVEIGGIQQWITIRGEHRNNPVLLHLHGGPGDATNPWGYAGFRLWLEHFTVVQWDQRGAGRTFGRNRDAPREAITIALAGDFAVPVFVIQGAEDFTTPTSLARAFVESIHAPAKEFVTIEGGHFAVFMKPAAFLDRLVPRVLPLTR